MTIFINIGKYTKSAVETPYSAISGVVRAVVAGITVMSRKVING
jgi:hypothetical protein